MRFVGLRITLRVLLRFPSEARPGDAEGLAGLVVSLPSRSSSRTSFRGSGSPKGGVRAQVVVSSPGRENFGTVVLQISLFATVWGDSDLFLSSRLRPKPLEVSPLLELVFSIVTVAGSLVTFRGRDNPGV